MDHATVFYSQAARSSERKIEDAASNPRSPVSNTNDYGSVVRRFGYTNPRAEWQASVRSSQRIPIERGAAGCFSLRV
jgi:hypothetical protein